LLKSAIAQFRAQDYPAKHLVIVEDGPEKNRDLLDSEPEFTYVHLGADRLSIGRKRNEAIALAAPGLIAHWDDDDWNSPHRLSTQVAELEKARAVICGLDRLLFFDGQSAWLYRSIDPAWIAGGTLIYQRAVWEAQPFADRSNGEDTLFSRAAFADGLKTVRVPNERLYVARIHEGNTARKVPDAQWSQYDASRVRRLIGNWGTAWAA
jgi:hypothetical protein